MMPRKPSNESDSAVASFELRPEAMHDTAGALPAHPQSKVGITSFHRQHEWDVTVPELTDFGQ